MMFKQIFINPKEQHFQQVIEKNETLTKRSLKQQFKLTENIKVINDETAGTQTLIDMKRRKLESILADEIEQKKRH